MIKKHLNHFFLSAISFFILSCAIPNAQAAVSPLNFTVNMSEPVIVNTTGGTPSIDIDIGGVPNTATFASGSGTSALTFTYTPVKGDVDLDGIAMSSPVNLNGGTMKDTAGNDANLTFTPPVTTGIKVNYPSLSLDFINDRYSANGNVRTSLSTFLSDVSGTFTRASVGTYYDAAGVLQTASNNTPRFDYDPITHAAKGILVEEQRTNSFLRSEEFDNAAWSKSSNFSTVTVSADQVTAPDGNTKADRINYPAISIGGQQAFLAQSFAQTSSATYTFSVYAKGLAGGETIYLSATPDGTNYVRTQMPLTTSWQRFSVRFTRTSSDYFIRIGIDLRDSSQTAQPTQSVYLWGAQVEQGSFSTSYIPTTATTVTRAADSFVIPTGSWFDTTMSTLYGYGSVVNLNGAATFADINNNNWSERFQIRIDSGPHYSGIITKANVVQTGVGSGTAPINTPIKMVMAAKANDAVLYANGASRGTSSSLAMPTAQTQIRIGAVSNGAEYMNGTLQTIKYYPKRIDNAQLLLMTQ